MNGSYNLLTDTNSMSNGGNGFAVFGDYNQLLKLDSGDRGKGNSGDGFNVVGASNQLSENDAVANKGDGFDVSGAATSATANKLKKDVSNTGASGSDKENAGPEFRLLGFVKNDGGGNKADSIVIPKTSAPTKGALFPATNLTKNFAAEYTIE